MELIILFVLYFVPSAVAVLRNHTSTAGIIILNALLGWTFLGWIGALVWAASGQHPPKQNTGVHWNRKEWSAR